MEDRTKVALTVIAVGFVARRIALSIKRTALVEKEKRVKIEAWKQENLACINNSRERLTKMLDKGVDAHEFWQAYTEEMTFLKIIENQPMY